MLVLRILIAATIVATIFFKECRAGSQDTVLVIRERQETFPLNPYTFLFKDYSGQANFEQIRANPNWFQPLNDNHFFFNEDKAVTAFWGRASINNLTAATLRYVLYFHPGIDTIEIWIENPDTKIQKILLSSIIPTSQRPIHIGQELCTPFAISPGITTLYFRIPNQSIWNRELASLVVNLAEENQFVNYFLWARSVQGFTLGIVGIMVIFHFIIYLFFRDSTYLLLVINLLFTLIYLLILKHYHAELPLPPFWLEVIRYIRNPAAILICITSLLFTQSFLNTRTADAFMHRIMNYLIAFSSMVVLCMISLQFLHTMESIGIYLALITFLAVIITSVRVYINGNGLALYTLFGYAGFLSPIAVYFFPLSYTDYRANETDFHYYAEAFRAVVFAVGVANRFKRVQQNAIQLQLEKNQLALTKELQLQAERDRIRRDLHDSLGGQLSSLSIGLSRLHDKLRLDSILNLQSITDKATTELRDSLWLLDKNQVSIEELEQRINNLFWQYRTSEVATVLEIDVDDMQQQLTSTVAGHLFRIIQESVQNAIKHSGANKIQVFISRQDKKLKIKIEDNGCGFEWPANLGQDHYGLRNMQKRADQINGIFSISSSVGQGTSVAIEFNP